jgi:hypothetical protein
MRIVVIGLRPENRPAARVVSIGRDRDDECRDSGFFLQPTKRQASALTCPASPENEAAREGTCAPPLILERCDRPTPRCRASANPLNLASNAAA